MGWVMSLRMRSQVAVTPSYRGNRSAHQSSLRFRVNREIRLISGYAKASRQRNRHMLAHDVFFTLTDSSPKAVDALVSACHKYLKNHPGVEFFAAGKVGTE